MKRIIPLLLAALLLCGCAPKDEGPALGSQLFEVPALTYGVMESEKLEVLPWDSGRCEATSFFFMLETKLGYYMNIGYRYLMYADKENLANWVPVCNKPTCGHTFFGSWSYGQTVCNSEQHNTLHVKDGRIWYEWMPYGKEYDGLGGAVALMSMDPDGTNKKIECLMGEEYPTIRTYSLYTCPQYTYYNNIEIDNAGNWMGHGYRVMDGKLEEYTAVPVEAEDYDKVMIKNAFAVPVYGDPLLYNGLLVPTETSYLHDTQNGQEILELAELPANFSYLSGDVLRYFTPGDGYYDRNIHTGETVKLADCQLENSHAAVALPNCILESTLLTYYSIESRTPGQTHSFLLFDGERWREVALPPELQVTDDMFLRFKCVSSDSVILKAQRNGIIEQTDMYRIDLTKEDLFYKSR